MRKQLVICRYCIASTAHALLENIGYGKKVRHSSPQSPRSFWPVAGIESSDFVQHRKSAIHGLPVKSDKSDWLIIRN